MYDVVEIATDIVISEWHTKEEAQEQVDRFNKSANRNYFEVREHQKDNTIICSDLNEDGTCKYAKEEFNKVVHCNNVECYRRWANEYKQKYEKLLNNIINVSCDRKIASESFCCNEELNNNVKNISKNLMFDKIFEEIKKYIKCKEVNTNDGVRIHMELKIYKDEH